MLAYVQTLLLGLHANSQYNKIRVLLIRVVKQTSVKMVVGGKMAIVFVLQNTQENFVKLQFNNKICVQVTIAYQHKTHVQPTRVNTEVPVFLLTIKMPIHHLHVCAQ